MEPDSLTRYKTKTVVELLALEGTMALPDVKAAVSRVPTYELVLLGEFLHCRSAGAVKELTLLDPLDQTFSMIATLPREVSLPDRGRVLGVVGRLAMRSGGAGPSAKLTLFMEGRILDGRDKPGRLFRERRELFEQLADEVEQSKDRTLNRVQTVALVTGSGHAEKDFLMSLNPEGKPPIRVKKLTARLADPREIAARIQEAAADPEVDALVITRGGGAPEDLHRFNSAEVIRAVGSAVKKKYVITAIGHAADRTQSDGLAHHCANVPADAGRYLRRREADIFFNRRAARVAGEAAALGSATGDGQLAEVPTVRHSSARPDVIYQYLPARAEIEPRHRRATPTYVPGGTPLRERIGAFVRYRVGPLVSKWTRRAVLVGSGLLAGWIGRGLDQSLTSVRAIATPVVAPSGVTRQPPPPRRQPTKRATVRKRIPRADSSTLESVEPSLNATRR